MNNMRLLSGALLGVLILTACAGVQPATPAATQAVEPTTQVSAPTTAPTTAAPTTAAPTTQAPAPTATATEKPATQAATQLATEAVQPTATATSQGGGGVSNAGGVIPIEGLLLYDPTTGNAEMYTTDGKGNIGLLNKFVGWNKHWTITPDEFGGDAHTDLLLYDPTTGNAEMYTTDGKGNIGLLNKFVGWNKNWTIFPGIFGG